MNAELRIKNVQWSQHDLGIFRSVFIIHHSEIRNPAFTLVELMVVVTLMSIIVGLTVFRLDDVTTSGRLHSAASQIASAIRLAQDEARVTGSPRKIEYDAKGNHLLVRRPQLMQGHWQWEEGQEIALDAQVERILKENGGDTTSKTNAFVIGNDGRVPTHAVVLEFHEQWCVLVLRGIQEPYVAFLSHRPNAENFEAIVKELESTHGKN